MAHAFKIIPATPTFGTLKQNLYQSDYIKRKKSISCMKSSKITTSKSYEMKYSYNQEKNHVNSNSCNIIPVNKSNLIIGQYSKLNLDGVCTVSVVSKTNRDINEYDCDSTPVQLDPSVIFYENYLIDPLGQLFGKSQCGELNYTRYMNYSPPDNV